MFYIYDCKGNIVGNPKGYRTMHGAERVARHHRPTKDKINEAYDAVRFTGNKMLFEIKRKQEEAI